MSAPGGRAPPRPAAPAPAIHYERVPQVWAPVDEPHLDRVTRTDLRLALAMLVAGTVAVFVVQVPLLGQVVVGAPLFEEFFKLGLALLPWAALGVASPWARVPTAAAVGAGFGALEHFLSYPGEPVVVLYGRLAFHGLTAALSMLVLHGLRGADRRLLLASTLPASFLHAANNSLAVAIGFGSAFAGADPDAAGQLGLAVAAGVLLLVALTFLAWPLWQPRYRRLAERWLLPRLRPLGSTLASASRS